MKNIFFIFCFIFMAGCSFISPADKSATETAVIEASDARKTKTAATQAALPTSTPAPTRTPDRRSALQKCIDNGIGVRYVLTDKNVGKASVTLQNDTGGTEQTDVLSPYCREFTGFTNGDFLYISAQILSKQGELTCIIYDGTKIISQATANGQYNIATCSGNK